MEIFRTTAVASFATIPLIDASSRPSYKASPTLAAGDVKIIRFTAGAWNIANIGTLPAIVDGSATKQLLVTLTATELTTSNLEYPIIIQFIDQTNPKEWDDQEIIIWTKPVAGNSVQLGGNTASTSGTVTFPAATIASTTNITAGTITTATNLTNERAKYMHGSVWISAAGAAGTTNYTNGIMTNPVTGIANAKTIADSLLLRRFYTQAGTTVTLVATMDGYVFDGIGWTLALGGQPISNAVFMNARSITGVSSSSGPTAFPTFIACEFGATATIPASNLHGCSFGGTVTLVGGGNYDFIDCTSVVAGTSTPIFDVNSVSGTNISFRRWSGGITINNIAATTVISIDVVSGGTVTLNGVSGNVQVRGMCSGIVDNRTGTPTLGMNAACNQTTLATPTNITAGTITTVSNANATSINGSAPAAVQLGKSANTIVSASVNIVDFTPTTTQFETADLTNPDADFYKDATAIFTSGTLTNQRRKIYASSFNGGTGKTKLTVSALTSAPASGVTFNIV